MAVRTAYVATEVAGDILTASNFDKLPGGLIGYSNVTSSQTGITTITDLTSLSVAVTVNTSRIIKIEGFANYSQVTTGGVSNLVIRESSTTLGNAALNIGASGNAGMFVAVIISPTTGAHTYKLSASTNLGTVGTSASATQPAYIAVYDLGPAF